MSTARPQVENKTGRVYNCNVVVSPAGEILCKHRKVHLFDIDVPGKITFRESDTLTGGDKLTLFDTPWGRVGVGICVRRAALSDRGSPRNSAHDLLGHRVG